MFPFDTVIRLKISIALCVVERPIQTSLFNASGYYDARNTQNILNFVEDNSKITASSSNQKRTQNIICLLKRYIYFPVI
jgi:hypothetical protein